MHLSPMTPPHGVHDETILEFAIQMTQLATYPTNQGYSQDIILGLLKNAAYLVKYQKCVYGEISQTRFFMPHSTEDKFIEIEEKMVKYTLEEGKWRDSMRYLKLRCESHDGPLFICRIMQREDSPNGLMEKEVPAVKKIDLLDRICDHDAEE
jgi:hypothetical protein